MSNMGISMKKGQDYFYEMASFFSVFSDPTRLKILHTLLDGEKCVKKISEIVKLNPSACSHQLKILRHYKLVKTVRVGKYVRYSLNDDHIRKIIEIGEEHVREILSGIT